MANNPPPKKKDDSPGHGTMISSGAGSVAGGGLATAFLGPEWAAIGAGIGAAAGGSSALIIAQQISRGNLLRLPEEILIREKLHKDFNYSAVNESSQIKRTRKESISRINLLSEITKGDFARCTKNNEAKWLQEEHRAIVRASSKSILPDEFRRIADHLRRHSRDVQRLVASCQSIQPAVVATLKSLSDNDRFSLDIEIDYDDTCGVYQMDTVSHEKGAVDFLFSTNAPYFLKGFQYPKLQEEYDHKFEIHGQEQVLLLRRFSSKHKVRAIHIFEHSSAQEELFLNKDMYANTKQFSHQFYEDLQKVVANLEIGEVIPVWEPLATVLAQGNRFWIKRSEPAFINWVSLFCHKRWNSKKLARLRRQFQRLFLFEWLYCHKNRDWALNLLLNDSRYISRFAQGAGLVLPPTTTT